MRKYKEFPDPDEYVIVTITKINPNSAFARLEEYGKSGMIHISEVASTWIRDIRKHLSTGQVTVAKVIAVDKSMGHINLSLKRVKPNTKRNKVAEWKNEKKAYNLLEFVMKEMGNTDKKESEKVAFDIQKKFELIYSAFEIASTEGKDALIKHGVDAKLAEAIEAVAKKNIKPKEVFIKKLLILKAYSSDGVEVIKKALDIDAENIEISYISAPKYSIIVRGKEYPECETAMNDATEKIVAAIKSSGGDVEILKA